MSFSSDNPLVVNQLPISIEFPDSDTKEFINTLTLTYKRIADAVNRKEGSVFTEAESATFKQYPTNADPQTFKNVYRKTFDLISLNGGANIGPAVTVSFPHGITGIVQGVMIYVGCTSTAPEYFSVMFPSVWLDNTNINFTNPSASPVTLATAVAEYLKN